MTGSDEFLELLCFRRVLKNVETLIAHPHIHSPGKMQPSEDDPTRTPPTSSTVRHACSVIALGEDP